MTRAQEILDKHLKQCYDTHGEKVSIKYNGYLKRAAEEIAYEAFMAGMMAELGGGDCFDKWNRCNLKRK